MKVVSGGQVPAPKVTNTLKRKVFHLRKGTETFV